MRETSFACCLCCDEMTRAMTLGLFAAEVKLASVIVLLGCSERRRAKWCKGGSFQEADNRKQMLRHQQSPESGSVATRGQAEAEAELRDDDDYQVVLRGDCRRALVQNSPIGILRSLSFEQNYRSDKKTYPPYVP